MKNLTSYEQPLLGRISIHQVAGKTVNSKLSMIVILEVTMKSLLFVSQLKFPLSESVIYQVDTTIADNKVELFGLITKSVSNTNSNCHHYQFDYISKAVPFTPGVMSKLTIRKGENRS
ncbi:hypothetical protein [Halalkalibacter okhensis]|uniref:Uncharacterized protein n=1 Tax=Halalkalibacter okhensis TaxID=333138 RepID=A0A0B0IEP3_9BACI|nr:hypothetical protein [Halalkalibacter okhensis]KHF38146.1 hypothetical protein LQ50_23080 [Halalkalibacter okhensis]